MEASGTQRGVRGQVDCEELVKRTARRMRPAGVQKPTKKKRERVWQEGKSN